MYYAGIGSRESPTRIIDIMQDFAKLSAEAGHILRSGGADGADTAFEVGCDAGNGKKEIFLPWKGFNKNPSPWFVPTLEAYELASTIHPAYERLRPAAKTLIARNMHQILGVDLKTPVSCVVCWTQDGCESHQTYSIKTGGTGTAIALASKNIIPVFNLKNPESFYEAMDLLLPVNKLSLAPLCNINLAV
jgi:hypothetical protein